MRHSTVRLLRTRTARPGAFASWFRERRSASLGIAIGACACLAAGASENCAAATRLLQIAATAVRVELEDTDFRGGSAPLLAWIQRSGAIVAQYYGRFPTEALRVRVLPVDGDGVKGGTTFGRDGGSIRVRVGRNVTATQLTHDWVLVHEMIHLALPDVGEDHSWLSEGIATYVEGIARAQAGNRTSEDLWAEQLHSMPQGLPQAGDRGLDNTHTWGRIYWGGALFCLEADVEIHRQTHNRFGLQDALRAVNRVSGGIVADWPVERVFSSGDHAVGQQVLQDLYARTKDAPAAPDLPALWKKLGIEARGAGIVLHDDAPLAQVRKAITRSRTGL